MVQFVRKNDTLFAIEVDVKRTARAMAKDLPNLFPELKGKIPSTEGMLEFTVKSLGSDSYFAALRSADDPYAGGMDHDALERLVASNAITTGQRFPSGLPRKFDKAWQFTAMQLFAEARAKRVQGKLEFIAIVGGRGSGKTLLAKNACSKYGGKVIDVDLSICHGTADSYKPGELLIYDRPAEMPMPHLDFGSRLGLWREMPANRQKLSVYTDLRRNRPQVLAHDDIDYLGKGLRNWVKSQTDVCLVACLASNAEVYQALTSGPTISRMGSQSDSADFNWRGAHVVNLETMTYEFIEGPGLQMENGTYQYPS